MSRPSSSSQPNLDAVLDAAAASSLPGAGGSLVMYRPIDLDRLSKPLASILRPVQERIQNKNELGPFVPPPSTQGVPADLVISGITYEGDKFVESMKLPGRDALASEYIATGVLPAATLDLSSLSSRKKVDNPYISLDAMISSARRAQSSKSDQRQQNVAGNLTPYDISRKRKVTSSERKAFSMFEIPEDSRKYDLYKPLNKLWLSYMADLLGKDTTPAAAEPKMLKADLHGCVVRVTKAKCPTLIGLQGILLQEFETVFKVICSDDTLKTVPKIGCVFTIDVGPFVMTLYGSQFLHRTYDRVAKKMRGQTSIDL